MLATDDGTSNRGKIGTVFEMERFAINDGPGIRTVVFLKGCPLKCLWCCNPESQAFDPQLVYWSSKCLGCGACIKTCPNKALKLGPQGVIIEQDKCQSCRRCTLACNSGALTFLGRKMSVAEVLSEVLRDEHFYRASNGGVTFSGGEALAQPDFLEELAKTCQENLLHVCLETTGYVPPQVMARIIPYIDLFLYDFKQMDSSRHQKLTGVSNQLCLENFKRLLKVGKQIIARVPVIPGLNDDPDNYQQLVTFLKQNAPEIKVDLLPYHRLGNFKYQQLEREYQLKDLEPPSEAKMNEIRQIFEQAGFEVNIGG